MALIFTMESIRYPILLWEVYTVPSYYSDLVRSGTAHWSYDPLVLRPIGPTTHWSYKSNCSDIGV